jgi:hypothetical protein
VGSSLVRVRLTAPPEAARCDHRQMEAIDDLLGRIEAGELGDPLPVVAYLAGRSVELPPAELNEARRRALLLLAAGGDPRRELTVDDRAVKALALDLFADVRREQLTAGLDDLALTARELPRIREAVLFLAADLELAWRLLALALLAEELGS